MIADQEVERFDLAHTSWQELASAFGGQQLPEGSSPLSSVYSGHQFDAHNPQPGDGRGILFGVVKLDDSLWDLHIKDTGLTPYSRFGDGYAVLRSCTFRLKKRQNSSPPGKTNTEAIRSYRGLIIFCDHLSTSILYGKVTLKAHPRGLKISV